MNSTPNENTQFDDSADVGEPDSYHGYSVDDEDQPQSTGDSTADSRGLAEPLDEGYSPPERWSPAQRSGNTPREEVEGEPLDARIAQEEPEPDPYEAAMADADADNVGGEIGAERSGRLVAPGDGATSAAPAEMVARDVGIDGAGASAEEAAMHVIPE